MESEDRIDATSGNAITLLIDYNLEGLAVLLWGTLASQGWLDLVSIRFASLEEVGLAPDSDDRSVWRCAQSRKMILLTANRSMRGAHSLEQTIREENLPTSLPVVTVSSPEQLDQRLYRESCASRLLEILVHLDNYLGTGRVFVP